jgi:rubredoxin
MLLENYGFKILIMKIYKCVVCGFLYDPQQGDPDSGIEPGIEFTDLPEDYICPICGAGKDEFEEYE